MDKSLKCFLRCVFFVFCKIRTSVTYRVLPSSIPNLTYFGLTKLQTVVESKRYRRLLSKRTRYVIKEKISMYQEEGWLMTKATVWVCHVIRPPTTSNGPTGVRATAAAASGRTSSARKHAWQTLYLLRMF